jgi:putative transcriptional regulator
MSSSDQGGESDLGHAIQVHLDELLADRGMTLTELADRTGIAIVNLSILKNGHARAMRFTTLSKICDALGCQPGDLITHSPQLERFLDSQTASQ